MAVGHYDLMAIANNRPDGTQVFQHTPHQKTARKNALVKTMGGEVG
jgi:hypothetical protein